MSNELERLEAELTKLTKAQAKAESIVEQTQEVWKRDYETDDVDEIAVIRDNLATKIKKAESDRQDKLAEAAKLLGVA